LGDIDRDIVILSLFRYINQYASGIKKRLTTVPRDIPPIKASAMGRCSSDPMPELKSSGIVDTIDAIATISIGFNLREPAV
jgi:hypothetical protein